MTGYIYSREKRIDVPLDRRRRSQRHAMDPESFGRLSEQFARYMGTPKFLIQMTVFIAAWMIWNFAAPVSDRFDPYTFTFLTLILSLQASYAAPLILLAQNRQESRDKVMLEGDRERAQRSLSDTDYLAREIADIRRSLGELSQQIGTRNEKLLAAIDRIQKIDGDNVK